MNHPRNFALALVLVTLIAGIASALQTTTLNVTTTLSTDGGFAGRVSVGTTTLDTTGASLHVEGNTLANGTVNATKYQLGAWNARYTGNLSSSTLTANHTWTLQDADGVLGMIDAAQSVTGLWTFLTNPTFNANGVSWASVSKSGSSLADLTTRSASDLTSGTLARARADTATAYTDTAQSWTAVQSVPGVDLKIVGSNDASKSLRFDLTGKGANFVSILNDSSTQDRSWFLPDHNGTLTAANATETISGAWTFSTNPAFNANGVSWASVSKSGSSLADLTTRSATDLTSGTLARARADAATAYTDMAQSWTGVQSIPGVDLKVVGSNDASKSLRFDLTGKGANFVSILNDSSTQDRSWFLPDHNGTLTAANATETISGAWTFSTNPTFNANGVSWASVSKSGSSLADLATRSASDLSSGTLADGRLSSNVPLKTDNLGVFASTTSAQVASVVSDESGTGALIFATSPTFVTPNIADAIANTVVATGKVTASDIYAPNGVFNNTLTFGAGSGTTLIDSGKVAASNGFFPNAQVNTTLLVGQASQSKDEILGVTPTASIAGSASPWSAPGLKVANATVTYTGATGETAFVFMNDIGISTLTASTTAATVPIAASFRVEGSPTCNSSGGAAITCTNTLGLWASGSTRFDGQVSMTGTSAAPSGAARLSITPSTTTAGSSSVRTGAIALPANTLTFTGGTAQSGDLVDSDIGIRTYTAATTAGTSTNAATLKVDGAPVCNSSGGAAQTCTNLQAFWVAGGLTQLDGNVKIGASGTSIGFFGAAVHAKDTLTDSTGGSTGTSCAAITAGVTYSQSDGTAIKNCLASLLLVMHDYGMVG